MSSSRVVDPHGVPMCEYEHLAGVPDRLVERVEEDVVVRKTGGNEHEVEWFL